MAFRGSAPAKLDDRGRLKIPAAFRGELETASQVFVTCRGGPAALLYPMKTFEEDVEQRLDTQAGLNAEPSRLLRQLNANGMTAELDAQGRLTLSQDLRARTGLEAGKEIRVIGMNRYLEIWTEEAYREEERRNGV